ncbi:MAG: caspase family protein [Crocinitomicaceae bacterium]
MSVLRKIVLLFCCLQFTLLGQNVIPIFQTGHFSKINKVRFHSNNQNLISIGDDGKIIVWDINLGLQRSEVLAHQNGVLGIDFVNDSVLISLGNNNDIKTWSFPNLNQLSDLKIDRDSIQAITIIHNNSLCLVGKLVHFYNLEKGTYQTAQYRSKWLFKSVDFHKKRNEIVVTGPKDNYAVAIDLKDPVLFRKYFIGNIHSARFADSLLLLASTNGRLQHTNLNSDKKLNFTLTDDLNYVSDMDAQNNIIALGTAFGFTTIFSSINQKIIANIGLNGIPISTLSYSQDKKWLAIANTKGTIYLYDAENYKLNKILKGASASITDLKVFDDNMVIGYSDGILRHIHLPTNQIKSNSVKLNQVQEQNGINYAVLSVDTIINGLVELTVLKSDRHYVKTSLITNAQKIKATWQLDINKITLAKIINDKQIRKLTNTNFKANVPFQFSDYSIESKNYIFNNAKYSINPKNFTFSKLVSEKTITYPLKHTAPVTGLRFLPSHQLILSFSNDGSIRFWDTQGKYLAVLYLSGQYSFFYQNTNNFYFASKEILNKIGFIYNQKLFAYEQYDVYYNRPDEVMKQLPFFDKKDISNYQKAYFKRLQKLGILKNDLKVSDNLPEIIVDYFDEYSTKKDVVNFSLTMADLKGDIAAYSYLINGIEKRFDLKEPKPNVVSEIQIVLSSGINQVEFYCTNSKGVKSLIKKKIITCEKNFNKPDLYLVTIGVTEYDNQSFNLKYAKQDAEDISQILSDTKTYSNIKTKGIFDASFTKETFREMSDFLDTARINDVIVFFYAGHGVLDDEFNYYLATHNMDFDNPKGKGLLFDSIENMFEGLECRNKLMMIDACFSGEIDKTSLSADTTALENLDDVQFRSTQIAAIDGNGDMGIFELSKLIFTDLRVSKGTNILSSSSGIEYALEGDKWGNGLFTYVLKKGLIDQEADLNDDKQIRIMELQVYLRETVSALSEGRQNPILRKENIKNNFVVW